MNRTLPTVLALVLFFWGTATILSDERSNDTDEASAESTPQTEHDRWMAVKLSSSQHVFEALTRGDFQQLETSARRMQVLNLLEQWDRCVRDCYAGHYSIARKVRTGAHV